MAKQREARNNWYQVEWDVPPRLHFNVPTPEIEASLFKLFASSAIVGFDTRADVKRKEAPDKFRDPDILGSLQLIMARLMEVLQADYDLNSVQCAEWNGRFEYLVHDSFLSPGGFEVLTRLFSDAKPTGILYGRCVRRIDEHTYAMWIDD